MGQRQQNIWRLPDGGGDDNQQRTTFAAFTRGFLRKSRSLVKQPREELPQKVRGLINRIEQQTNACMDYLFDNGYEAKKVIYLYLHTQGSNAAYTGSAWNGLPDRTPGHLRAAVSWSSLPTDNDKERRKKRCAYGMYEYWAKWGLVDMIVIPLQIAPNNCTKRQLLCYEQWWMDSLGTLEFGYNHKRAVAGDYGMVRQSLAYRVYGFRDMERRIGYLSDQLPKMTLKVNG